MLNNVSWESFWTVIALTVTTYYVAVFLIYFREDFQKFRLPKNWFISREGIGGAISSPPSQGSILQEISRSEELIVYACLDEIKALFEQFKSSKGVRQEIIQALRQVLDKYATLKDSPYRRTIDHVVVFQAEQICSIHLSSGDMDQVWIG